MNDTVNYDQLIDVCDREIAKLKAVLAAAEEDPRKRAHFRTVATRYISGGGCTEDELVEALDDDYFWSVEEKEAAQRLCQLTEIRSAIIDARDWGE